MFAQVYSKFVDPALRELRESVPVFAGMKAGDRVLDVCCGTGDQALHYARRGINAVGIDIDPNMIEMAERNRRRGGTLNASFQVADAQQLPFREGLFDYVTVSLALHEKGRATRDAVISEMERLAKDEGGLVFVDFAVPLPRNAYGILVRTVEFFAGWDHFRCSRDYLRQGGLDILLEGRGLREESRLYLKYGTVVLVRTAAH